MDIHPVQLWERARDKVQAGVLRVEGDVVVLQTWNTDKGWWGNEFLRVDAIDIVLDWVLLPPLGVPHGG